MSKFYYLITSLPMLPPLGDPPPITLDVFRRRCGEFEQLSKIVDATLQEPVTWDPGIWSEYYFNVYYLANLIPCAFARQWVEFDVGLKNALAADRASALGVDFHLHMVADELAGESNLIKEAVSRWTQASNPMEGQRILDETRWDWIGQNAGWFSFDIDEPAAYCCCLMLLHKWGHFPSAEGSILKNSEGVAHVP